MKIHRFIFTGDISSSQITLQDEALVHQLFHVLRLQPGEYIQLCDGRGQEVKARILEISKKNILLHAEERLSSISESVRRITLYVSILKRENMAWVVQKATEVGVAAIVPVICHRTVKQEVRMDRLQEIAREAAEQSGRGIVPVVHEPMSFGDALSHAQKNEENVFFHTNPLTDSAQKHPHRPEGTMGVFVGPEGGWDEEEVAQAVQRGCCLSSLGSFVLRGETAAVVASYAAVHGLLF